MSTAIARAMLLLVLLPSLAPALTLTDDGLELLARLIHPEAFTK